MRQPQRGGVEDGRVVKQQVEVDGASRPAPCTLAAELVFDFGEQGKDRLGPTGRLEQGGAVEIGRFVF